VFAYGSLVHPRARPCRLRGHRRRWAVAMDNTRTIPGYKVYVDARGERPPVFVTFLDVAPADGHAAVNGALFPVAPEALTLLDHRERNYERREVTELVDADVGGPVFAYVGRAEARERYARGAADGTAVVSRAYHDRVRADFAAFGPGALDEFDRTTEPPTVPLVELTRIEVPER
jgi:cation transport regulator ChaC